MRYNSRYQWSGMTKRMACDPLTRSERSTLMSKVRSKNTGPELLVRSELHRLGFRFRLHKRDLPGCPDIALVRYRTVIFVHGCFWHMHRGCKDSTIPKSNVAFWRKKLHDNAARFRRQSRDLKDIGWRIIVIWECQLKRRRNLISMLAPLIEMRSVVK